MRTKLLNAIVISRDLVAGEAGEGANRIKRDPMRRA
jgi:hypothetical protein